MVLHTHSIGAFPAFCPPPSVASSLSTASASSTSSSPLSWLRFFSTEVLKVPQGHALQAVSLSFSMPEARRFQARVQPFEPLLGPFKTSSLHFRVGPCRPQVFFQ
ncbi:hypothetical protein B0H12DRAFT_1147338 [Mycena haematopus]|nr:hypothetical protein B0H12DRAFT_1147338 [Mycena haematopus]